MANVFDVPNSDLPSDSDDKNVSLKTLVQYLLGSQTAILNLAANRSPVECKSAGGLGAMGTPQNTDRCGSIVASQRILDRIYAVACSRTPTSRGELQPLSRHVSTISRRSPT